MNNINRRQQIPVAFNQEKAMTYGSALRASQARNVELSNLNRMSNATNPWARKVAQNTLSNNWVDYQNQLVQQASGTTPQQEFYQEALGKIRNPQRVSSMASRNVQSTEAQTVGFGLSDLFDEYRQQEAGGWREHMGSGASQGSLQSQDTEELENEIFHMGNPSISESEFVERSRARVASEARISGLSSRQLLEEQFLGDPVEIEARYGVEGGEAGLGGRTSSRMELISPEMFEQAVREQEYARMEFLTTQTNPLSFISMFDSDIKPELQNLDKFGREALQQGVEQDFSTPDVSLRRINRFRDAPELQNASTFGTASDFSMEQQEFNRAFSSRRNARFAGLPEFEFQASGAQESGGFSGTREQFDISSLLAEVSGGGSAMSDDDYMAEAIRFVQSNPGPENSAEFVVEGYTDWVFRNLRQNRRMSKKPFDEFFEEYFRSTA